MFSGPIPRHQLRGTANSEPDAQTWGGGVKRLYPPPSALAGPPFGLPWPRTNGLTLAVPAVSAATAGLHMSRYTVSLVRPGKGLLLRRALRVEAWAVPEAKREAGGARRTHCPLSSLASPPGGVPSVVPQAGHRVGPSPPLPGRERLVSDFTEFQGQALRAQSPATKRSHSWHCAPVSTWAPTRQASVWVKTPLHSPH